MEEVPPVETDTVADAKWPPAPDISHLITEDDTPMESYTHDSQLRLLAECLNSSDILGDEFLVASDVALFFKADNPAFVPDLLLSVGVTKAMYQGKGEKEEQSYFCWLMGKTPDLVVEMLSKTKGEEHGRKFIEYARSGVGFYVTYDPERRRQENELECYVSIGGEYEPLPEPVFKRLGLKLTFWEGSYEGVHRKWIRWADLDDVLLPTNVEYKERADAENARADAENARADALAAEVEALRKQLADSSNA